MWERLSGYPAVKTLLLACLGGAMVYLHFTLRRWAGRRVARRMTSEQAIGALLPNYARAFRKNSRWFRSVLRRNPAGWGRRTARHLAQVVEDAQQYVQKLNDMYTNPSGEIASPVTCA